jgi:thiol-disulfide isomerase/thioredoxin
MVRGVRRLLASLAILSLGAAPPPPSRLREVGPAELGRALTPRERPLVVHLWASWCRPCLAELPALTRTLSRAAGNGVDVVLVSLDEHDRAQEAERALDGLPCRKATLLLSPFGEAEPVLRDVDPGWDGALPTTLLLQPGRQVALAQRGYTRLDALERALEAARPHPAAGHEGGLRR